jgi:hypothetical protein
MRLADLAHYINGTSLAGGKLASRLARRLYGGNVVFTLGLAYLEYCSARLSARMRFDRHSTEGLVAYGEQ